MTTAAGRVVAEEQPTVLEPVEVAPQKEIQGREPENLEPVNPWEGLLAEESEPVAVIPFDDDEDDAMNMPIR